MPSFERHQAIEVFLASKAVSIPSSGGTVVQSECVQWVHFSTCPSGDGDLFYADEHDDPSKVVQMVDKCRPHPLHMLSVFTTQPDETAEAYRENGYVELPRLAYEHMPNGYIQPLMARRIVKPEPREPGARRLRPAEWRKHSQNCHWICEADKPDSPAHRHYGAFEHGKVVSSASSWPHEFGLYLSEMGTDQEFRRRGFATKVLRRIHHDAARGGACLTVLCASPDGYPLYKKLGYEVAAWMQGFVRQDSPLLRRILL